jgi:hypothetical protein
VTTKRRGTVDVERGGRREAVCSPELLRTLEGIATVVDGWRRPSEMAADLAWLVAFMVGMWWVEPELDGGVVEVGTPEWKRAFQERGMELATRIYEIASKDRHRAWRLALERWVWSEPARLDDVENGTGVDYSRRLAERLEDLWPRLDDMSPFVGYELAWALACGAGEVELGAAARRLAPGLAEPGQALGDYGERQSNHAWLREVARQVAVLALKIGLEARLRAGVGVRGASQPSQPDGSDNQR